ncbi:hypothetical protein Tco_1508104 [Tanacetum coccineum]
MSNLGCCGVNKARVVPADYFFNNDLEYLKGGSSSRKYTTSITNTKAARYDNIEGIEDMVPELWSSVKIAYDKFAMWDGLLAKRKWSNLDRTRSRIMIKAIDQQLFERRLMRNLEKFIGGREYGNDFRLLEWTI